MFLEILFNTGFFFINLFYKLNPILYLIGLEIKLSAESYFGYGIVIYLLRNIDFDHPLTLWSGPFNFVDNDSDKLHRFGCSEVSESKVFSDKIECILSEWYFSDNNDTYL